MSVCAFDSLPKGKYSNLFIVAAFSNMYFSGKTSMPVKNPILLTFPKDKAEILIISLLNCIELFLLNFVIDCFNLLINTHFYNKFFLNCNGLSDDKVVLFTKNKYGS